MKSPPDVVQSTAWPHHVLLNSLSELCPLLTLVNVIVILIIPISISSPFTIPYQFPSTSLYPYLLHIPLPIFTTSPLPPNSIRTCEMRPVVCPKMWLNSFSCRTSMNVSNPNRFGLNQKISIYPPQLFHREI